MNVDGTRNVLDLVREIPGRRLHHVSTAYIAGNRSDLALETEIDIGQSFRNPYEESKCRAELMIADAHKAGNITASVYRPSIVIGDSKTGRVTHFHGVYAFVRALWGVLARMRRRRPDEDGIHLHLRVPGSTSGTLNFVQIDYVVDGMVNIGSRELRLGQVYNLT